LLWKPKFLKAVYSLLIL